MRPRQTLPLAQRKVARAGSEHRASRPRPERSRFHGTGLSSALQLRKPLVERQALGVGQGVVVLISRPWMMSRTASSVILPEWVRGMSGTATMRAGTCRGVAPVRILRRIGRLQWRRQTFAPSRRRTNRMTRWSPSQSWPTRPLRAPRGCLDLPVDFGGADAHAARIERGVRPPVDDHAAGSASSAKSPCAQTSGKALEIGARVVAAVGVAPESDRHRQKGLRQTSSPLACPRWVPPPRCRRPPCPASAPGSRRATPAASGRRRRNSRRCRCRPRSRRDARPPSSPNRRSRSSPATAATPSTAPPSASPANASWPERARPCAGVDVLGRRAEDVDPLGVDQVRHPRGAGVGRIAVVGDGGAAGGEAR